MKKVEQCTYYVKRLHLDYFFDLTKVWPKRDEIARLRIFVSYVWFWWHLIMSKWIYQLPTICVLQKVVFVSWSQFGGTTRSQILRKMNKTIFKSFLCRNLLVQNNVLIFLASKKERYKTISWDLISIIIFMIAIDIFSVFVCFMATIYCKLNVPNYKNTEFSTKNKDVFYNCFF